MKNTLLLLILLPLLSFGQSKKDLKARIYSMQLDSANQAELISDQQKMIAEDTPPLEVDIKKVGGYDLGSYNWNMPSIPVEVRN